MPVGFRATNFLCGHSFVGNIHPEAAPQKIATSPRELQLSSTIGCLYFSNEYSDGGLKITFPRGTKKIASPIIKFPPHSIRGEFTLAFGKVEKVIYICGLSEKHEARNNVKDICDIMLLLRFVKSEKKSSGIVTFRNKLCGSGNIQSDEYI